MKYCPDCGTEYLDASVSCADCGTELVTEKSWKHTLDREQHEQEALRTEPMERLCSVNGSVEAESLLALLKQDGIPALVRSYQETAFDGLFTNPQGWGEILVPASHLVEAQAFLRRLDENPPESLPEED